MINIYELVKERGKAEVIKTIFKIIKKHDYELKEGQELLTPDEFLNTEKDYIETVLQKVFDVLVEDLSETSSTYIDGNIKFDVCNPFEEPDSSARRRTVIIKIGTCSGD